MIAAFLKIKLYTFIDMTHKLLLTIVEYTTDTPPEDEASPRLK
jgi:hypothetical protein